MNKTFEPQITSNKNVTFQVNGNFSNNNETMDKIVGRYELFHTRIDNSDNKGTIAFEIIDIYQQGSVLMFKSFHRGQNGKIDGFVGPILRVDSSFWFMGSSASNHSRIRILSVGEDEIEDPAKIDYLHGLFLTSTSRDKIRAPIALKFIMRRLSQNSRQAFEELKSRVGPIENRYLDSKFKKNISYKIKDTLKIN